MPVALVETAGESLRATVKGTPLDTRPAGGLGAGSGDPFGGVNSARPLAGGGLLLVIGRLVMAKVPLAVLIFGIKHFIGSKSAGMFIQCLLFGLPGSLSLFFDMALLQRIKRFQLALRRVKFVTSSLGGYLAVLDQPGLLADRFIELVDELLKITQLGLIHAIP